MKFPASPHSCLPTILTPNPSCHGCLPCPPQIRCGTRGTAWTQEIIDLCTRAGSRVGDAAFTARPRGTASEESVQPGRCWRCWRHHGSVFLPLTWQPKVSVAVLGASGAPRGARGHSQFCLECFFWLPPASHSRSPQDLLASSKHLLPCRHTHRAPSQVQPAGLVVCPSYISVLPTWWPQCLDFRIHDLVG